MLGRWFFLAVVGIGLIVIVHGPGSGAGATITQSCASGVPGVVSVTFAWATPAADATASSLDLSVLPGFPPPLTNTRGPLPAAQTSYTVDALPLGVTLHYRVRTQAAAGATAVAEGSFKTKCDAPTAVGVARP